MADSNLVDWKKEYDALVLDARRYRWLRSEGLKYINFHGLTCDTCDIGLDYAIDCNIGPQEVENCDW